MAKNNIAENITAGEALLVALADIQQELKPLQKKEKEVKDELKKWAEKNRSLFNGESSLDLLNGILTYSQRADVEYVDEWQPKKLAAKYPALLQIKASALEKALDTDAKLAALAEEAGISLVYKEVFTAKAKG
jgi:hypothetical protein